MTLAGFSVRPAGAADLAAVIALERAVAEAPHWAEAEYAEMVGQLSYCCIPEGAQEQQQVPPLRCGMTNKRASNSNRKGYIYPQNTPGGGIGSGVRRCLFVAEVEGKSFGFAVGKLIGIGLESSAELESVAVDVGARRSGVGRALCMAVAEWCRARGAATLELEVRAASAGAIALYARLGFVSVGRRRDYYRDPVDDATLMRLDLA